MSLVKRINLSDEFVEVSNFFAPFYKKLGINECVSFINSKDEFSMAGCTAAIIASLESESVFFNVIKSKIKEYHDIYACGSKSLICIIGLLCEEVQKLLNQGIPNEEIIDALLYAEDKMITMLQQFYIPLKRQSVASTNPIETISSLKYYFTNYKKQVELVSFANMKPFVEQICHTKSNSLLKALNKAIKMLMAKDKSIQLWKDKVLILRIQHYGCNNYFVEDSLWLPITYSSSSLVKKSSKLLHRVLVIDGNINNSAWYNEDKQLLPILQVKNFTDLMSSQSSNDSPEWWQHLLNTLTKYCITCVILSGLCDPKMKHILESEYFVIVIENISKKTLHYLLNAMGNESVTFFNQASMNNILKDVSLSIVEETILRDKIFCRIKVEKEAKIITVICAHSSLKMTAILEESFMHNLFRVQHALNTEMVFPGEGHIERKVSSFLKSIAEKMLSTIDFTKEENDSDMKVSNQCRSQNFIFTRPVVINSLASGLERWANILTENLLQTNNGNLELEKKFDDPMTKVSSWRFAINTIVTLLSLGHSLELADEHVECFQNINLML